VADRSGAIHGDTGSSVHLHVEDVDAMTKQAVEAGAKVLMEPRDMFYGERIAKLLDPFGHDWMIGTHIEDVTPEETQRRFNALLEGAKKPS
jgi:PhnB protein